MSQTASEQEISQAVLEFASEGIYPESENVISSEVSALALSKELELMSEAREQVEKEIGFLSRENTFDTDGWMSQAKKLHVDIERSRLTAREIVAQHENTKPLELNVKDAAAKVELVQTEITFNQAVTSTLEEGQKLNQRLESGRIALRDGQVLAAIETVEETEKILKKDTLFTSTNIMNILSESITGLRQDIIEFLRMHWKEQVQIDEQQCELQIRKVDGLALEDTVAALLRLDVFSPVNEAFQKVLTSTIMDPVISPSSEGHGHRAHVGSSGIRVDHEPSALSVSEVLGYAADVLGYLRRCLPVSVTDPLSDSFIPALTSKLISFWLSPSIPIDLPGLGEFEKILEHSLDFSRTIESLGWHGQAELASWVNQAPRLWLARRRVDSLDQVRKVLGASQNSTRQVEKIETESVSHTDQTLPENSTSGDWDSAWDGGNNTEEEVTLRENYTVTDIPDSILAIIQRQIADADALSQPAHSKSRVASSGAGLLSLPTLIIAMYKATASSFYTIRLNAGQIYLYNDSQYLADQLRSVVKERRLTRFEADVVALEKFGKFSYSKEMQIQRTIVTDLLDGAQGFTHCSEQPYLGECENAISATVDRVRDVYREWQPIFSSSALLQSVGSLISTVLNKMIIEIEELGDISETQSQRLVSFCNQVSKLEDLFMSEPAADTESVPMTAIYVQNWFKFQYLINILESSLADIKFLWGEGELRLEFSADEVVDLIKALFAESDYRRKAIAEIRRTSSE